MKSSRTLFRFLVFLFVSFIGLCALGVHLLVLDHEIRAKFEAHRWNLPSRVYSDSFYIYPGQTLPPQKVARKLERLSYRPVKGAVTNYGEYSQSKTGFDIYLRNFSYPSEEFSGFPVSVTFDGAVVHSIKRLDTQTDLKALKIEPELIASIFDEKMEDRTIVTLDQIPEDLTDAVVAVEDERFYKHHGVDPQSILRALLTDILHFRAKQGGSTLTQQLVKNFFLSPEKTIVRKFNEILMAMILEFRYSKEEIMEAYLNEIYFGQRGPVSITGVEEASKFYFGKGVSHLSLPEAALVAGMIRAPGEYSPFRNPDKATERRNVVLRLMMEQGKITQEDFEEAKKEPIVLTSGTTKVMQAPFFIDFVQQQLKENYPHDLLKSEGLRIFTTLDMEAQEIAEAAVQKRLKDLEATKPKLKKIREDGKVLEGAFVAVQPQTGAVRAFVGGRDFSISQFDRVRDAHRQPGSAFKPFVYLAALEKDDGKSWTMASTIDDTAFSVKTNGKTWRPENYDKKEHGAVTLREALEDSYNIVASKLAIDVGLNEVIQTARAAGVESDLQPYPSLALGAFEVTPLELVRAYTIFPNQGTQTEPIAITSVVTRGGQVLEKKGFKMKKVVSPELAYLMNSALRGVIDRGTAAGARKMGFTGLAAGKTGTTSDYKDSWFVGYTPDLLALAWVGYDDGTATGLSGASGALPIWVDFMKGVQPSGALKEDFPGTDNISLVKVDRKGHLYKDSCGEAFVVAFIRGTEPKEECD